MADELTEKRVKLLIAKAAQHERKLVEADRQIAELNRVLAEHTALLAEVHETRRQRPLIELSADELAQLSDEQLQQLMKLTQSEFSRRDARKRFKYGFLAQG